MQFITGSNRHQTYFSTLEDRISADNSVKLIDAFIDKLELQKLGFANTVHKSEGRPPYASAVLLKLYLYSYINKIRSSRKLERKCSRNIELQWLLQNLAPNYHTISDFRKVHAASLKGMFRLYVQFLGDAGLLGKTTNACKTCPLKTQCTKLPQRIIQRSEFQDAVDINDNNIKRNPQYYKRRQAICEHPFGTIKRHFGFTHTLMKGLEKVNGEMNLIMVCYNFMRTKKYTGL